MSTVIQTIPGASDRSPELRLVEFDHYQGGRARTWEVHYLGVCVAELTAEQLAAAAAIVDQPEIVGGISSQAGLASFRHRR